MVLSGGGFESRAWARQQVPRLDAQQENGPGMEPDEKRGQFWRAGKNPHDSATHTTLDSVGLSAL